MADPTLDGAGFPWSTEPQIGYCSQADLEKKIGQRKLAELTNDVATQGKVTDGLLPDVDVVALLIQEADQDIDTIVGMRYSVPFAQGSIPDSIKFLSINMACFRAFKRRLPANQITKDWQSTYDECLKELNDIASGEEEIGIQANQKQGMITNTTYKQTQWENQDLPISHF